MALYVAVRAGVPNESAAASRVINLDQVTEIVEENYGLEIHFTNGERIAICDKRESELFLANTGLRFNMVGLKKA